MRAKQFAARVGAGADHTRQRRIGGFLDRDADDPRAFLQRPHEQREAADTVFQEDRELPDRHRLKAAPTFRAGKDGFFHAATVRGR